jgi:hypothetical protein
MHRHAAACSTPTTEQTQAAPGFAQEQPQAAVEPARLLCKALRARSSSVSALSRWTSRGGDSSLLLRWKAPMLPARQHRP